MKPPKLTARLRPNASATAPADKDGARARAFSPSALFMAVMASPGAGPKSREAIASKHLRRCGCTASGLRAWLRICWGHGRG